MTSTGYVCPDWAQKHWNRDECVIHQTTDGNFAVVDHSLNGVTIFVGTHGACVNLIGSEAYAWDEATLH